MLSGADARRPTRHDRRRRWRHNLIEIIFGRLNEWLRINTPPPLMVTSPIRPTLPLRLGNPFSPLWCSGASRSGDITRLIVTMPPRYLKSITVSVAWVAWMLR